MTIFEPIRYHIRQQHVVELILNRPEKANALNPLMIQTLLQHLQHIAQDSNLRVLILRSQDTFFCAGADLHWMAESLHYGQQRNTQDAQQLASLLHRLDTLPIATIAAVRGGAYGGGLGLLCCCDVVLTADDCRFAFSEVRLGLTPATILPYVLSAIGARQARRWLLSAETFGSEQALQLGLAHEIVPNDQLQATVQRHIDCFLRAGPQALRACKAQIQQQTPMPLAQIEQTAALLAQIRQTPEAQAGVKAFLKKTTPPWLTDAEP